MVLISVDSSKAGMAAPARRPRASEHTITQLKAAAYELIADGGLAALTISALTERSGYSTAIVNYHFGSKGRFLQHLFDDALKEAQNVVGLSTSGPDALSNFRQLFARMSGVLRTRRRAWLVYLNLLAASRGAEKDLANSILRHNRSVRDMFVGWIRQGQEKGDVSPSLDAEATAVAIYGAIRGIASLAAVDTQVDMQLSLDVLESWLAATFGGRS